jgi:hypothetical protein
MSSEDTKCDLGACPVCGAAHEVLNIGDDYWVVCHDHKTKWWIGSNIFCGWRFDHEGMWRENQERLATYDAVYRA